MPYRTSPRNLGFLRSPSAICFARLLRVSELLRSPADAGRAFAFFGALRKCLWLAGTDCHRYLVEATGNFDTAFILAGILALVGATATLALARAPIDEVRVTLAAQPTLAD